MPLGVPSNRGGDGIHPSFLIEELLAVGFGHIRRLIGVAILSLVGSFTVDAFLVPRIMGQLAKLRTGGMMNVSSLLFFFGMAYLANTVGLAPIVGVFAAGLFLEEVHFIKFRAEVEIEHPIKPISAFLVPVLFVLMGIQVRLETFHGSPCLE